MHMITDFLKFMLLAQLMVLPIKPLLAEVAGISPENISKQFDGTSSHQGQGASAITYKSFGKEFLSTNSLDDYHRSLSRIQNLYRAKLSDDNLSSVFEEMEATRLSAALMLFADLEKEALLKAENREDNFYQKLELLCEWLKSFSDAAYIEILLVDLQRKTVSDVKPLTNQAATTRFVYLIQHARYEVFSKMLFETIRAN